MEAVFGCFRMDRSPRRTTTAQVMVETSFRMDQSPRRMTMAQVMVETSFRMDRSPRRTMTAQATAATFGWFSFFVRSQGYSGLRAVSSEVGVWP